MDSKCDYMVLEYRSRVSLLQYDYRFTNKHDFLPGRLSFSLSDDWQLVFPRLSLARGPSSGGGAAKDIPHWRPILLLTKLSLNSSDPLTCTRSRHWSRDGGSIADPTTGPGTLRTTTRSSQDVRVAPLTVVRGRGQSPWSPGQGAQVECVATVGTKPLRTGGRRLWRG
jgi:hypothetical protein